MTYYIIAESNAICLGKRRDILNAVDILFKLHYVADVHFAPSLKFFYIFLETMVYEVGGVAAFPSVKALRISLLNTKLSSNDDEN